MFQIQEVHAGGMRYLILVHLMTLLIALNIQHQIIGFTYNEW
jgi:hypothetical protein